MPSYNYFCNTCDTPFDLFLKISDREVPLADPCPVCKATGGVVRHIGSPAIGDAFRLSSQRKQLGGFADVLENIATKQYKSNLHLKY